MSIESKKFPAVITTQNILGVEEGTVLRFDWASGKYVTVTESEDIAEDDYYYSGFAIALDPYVVKDNIGECFTYFESEKEEVESEEPQMDAVPQDEVEVCGPAPETEEYNETHSLVMDCSCGHRTVVMPVNAPGINITLMAGDEKSVLGLRCPECNTTFKLWFAPEETDNYEPTKEESK